MSAERIFRSAAHILSATTNPGPSAVNVRMDIGSAMMDRPASVRIVCKYNYISQESHLEVQVQKNEHKL